MAETRLTARDGPKVAEGLSLVLAAVLAVVSVGAILDPSVYAGETLAWRVQVEAQDWYDLIVAVPLLVLSALLTKRGSRVGTFLLGGVLMYAVYNLVIYAFAVRFNRWFILYCAALGLSVYALILHLRRLPAARARAWFVPDAARRFPAVVLIALAVMFLGLWLSELVPAALANNAPQSLRDVGLLTNPVHALDLSVTLPTFLLGGIWLWRGQAIGFLLGPMLLVFAILTDLAIALIILMSQARGVQAETAVAIVIALAAVVTTASLVQLLRGLQRTSAATAGEA